MKKAIWIGVLIALAGFLVFGAVNRTLAKSTGKAILWPVDESADQVGTGRLADQNGNGLQDGAGYLGGQGVGGQGHNSLEGNTPLGLQDASKSLGGQGQGLNRLDRSNISGEQTGEGNQGGNGYQGGKGGEQVPVESAGVPDPQAVVTDMFKISGVVALVDGTTLSILAPDGSTLVIEDRPWSYALEQGFSANVGDQLLVTGFYEGDKFEATSILDQTSSASVTLRDTDGRPGWAGNGRGRGGSGH